MFSGVSVDQDTIIELIRTSIRALFEMLDGSPGLPWHKKQELIERARGLMAHIRQAEGTIRSPEVWQEIHALANAVQVKLDGM